MKKRILLAAVAVVVGVPLLMTAWFYIGGIETGDTSLPDDADLRWTPPEVADEDNAFIAIMAATNLINCATLGTNSWDKADMSFVSGYANINTNRDSTARRIRAEPDAAEKADRIIADNEAFYAAFAKGLERKGFRNTLPPITKEIRISVLPFHVMNRMSNLWRLKIQREMERGERNAAVADLEVLHRFGQVVSDNAATAIDILVGNSIDGMAYGKMRGLAASGGLSASQLARLAELVDADAKAAPENVALAVKGEYSFLRANLDAMSLDFFFSLAASLTAVMGDSVPDDSFSDRVAEFLTRTIVRWPGYFRYALHRRSTVKRLADIAHKALNGEVDEAVGEDAIHFLLSRNGFGRLFVQDFTIACKVLVADKSSMLSRANTQLVIAVARWRLDHDGELPPTLDALVPQYLPAVPADPWSKDGKLLNYDAAAGVVWSVGESGDFDYSALPAEESKRLHGKIGRKIDRYAFRLDGRPLDPMDNAK